MTKAKTKTKAPKLESKAIEKSVLPWVEIGNTTFPVFGTGHILKSKFLLLFDTKIGIRMGQFVKNTVSGVTEVHSLDDVFLKNVTHYIVLTDPNYKPTSTTQN